MKRSIGVALILCCSFVATPGAAQETGSSLSHYDFGHRTSHFKLPGRLDEISGLAMTPDGRIFAHDDERAVVYEIDPQKEEVGKRFSLGDPPMKGDFEAIAIVGERFFMITSHGILYEFREAGDREQAPYRITDTQIGAVCEVEGLDYSPAQDELLVACKVSADGDDQLLVHRIGLDPARNPLPSLSISRDEVKAQGLKRSFAPSAIAVDPDGTLLLASARTEALLEVDPNTGRVIAGVHLSHDQHPQAEGLAFGLDGTLYVSDEAHGGEARFTSYARLPEGNPGS